MTQASSARWEHLDQNGIVKELRLLETNCAWLAIVDLAEPMEAEDVDRVLSALAKIARIKAGSWMSYREKTVLLSVVKASARNLHKIIIQIERDFSNPYSKNS